MSATPDSTLTSPEQRIADLERQLAEYRAERDACKAERDEALEQQTATAEVLGVINSSPGELGPVFDAMLERAMRLCGADFGAMAVFENGQWKSVATHGVPAAYAEFRSRNPSPPPPGGISARILGGEPFVHSNDLADDDNYRSGEPYRRALVDLGRARTSLAVALRRDREALGSIHIYRQEVLPFTDKHIALLRNVAAQAVIAMENARLSTETREALEQQTATAEVLQVINSSPGNLTPLFNALVETAARLGNTNRAGLATRDGDAYRYVATRSLSPEWDAYLRELSFTPGRGTFTGRSLLERRVIHVADIAADPEHAMPEIVTLGDLRSVLAVPLLRESEPIGVLAFARQHVEPFTERQIALAETFAAQAVIAMENARLLTETREALEQQTATAEVLQVINPSPGDLTPVFDAILQKAHSLCGAENGGLALYDGEKIRTVAAHAYSNAFLERAREGFPASGHPVVQPLLDGAQFVHIPDLAEFNHPVAREVFESTGVRTVLGVPLRRDNALLGVITSVRREIRLFTDKQIALLQNFAAQAVIAMENGRLLGELRQRTEEVSELNRGLETRVAEQVEELGRVG